VVIKVHKSETIQNLFLNTIRTKIGNRKRTYTRFGLFLLGVIFLAWGATSGSDLLAYIGIGLMAVLPLLRFWGWVSRG
jgi:hypothetical protein